MFKSKTLFSLVELIVVVAILSLLMSMLQPTLKKILKSADTVACANNLHQFYNIIVYYTDDHEGYFTPYGRPGGGVSIDTMWFARLENYHNNVQEVRLCPSANENDGTSWWGTASTAWNWGGRKGSYALNGFFHSLNHNWGDTLAEMPSNFQESYFINFDKVIKPNLTGMMADSSWVDAWPRSFQSAPSSAALGGQAGESGMSRLIVNRHDWATNVLKADGSVRNHSLEGLYSEVYWNLRDEPRNAPPIVP